MTRSNKVDEWLKSNSVEKYINLATIISSQKSNYDILFFVYCVIRDDWRHTIKLSIHGIFCENNNIIGNIIYDADIILHEDNKKIYLGDNVVRDEYRGKGIGSAGLKYIKFILQHFNYSEIYGCKHPIPNTPEQMALLTNYYEKNDFENLPNNKIRYVRK